MVASTLAANLRTSDVIARFGGEEFVILAQHADAAALEGLGERLRMLVEQASLEVDAPEPLRVTISLGATMAVADESPEQLLERADRLLYRSKTDGRNRVTLG